MTNLNTLVIKNEVIKLLVKLKNKNTGNITDFIKTENFRGNPLKENNNLFSSFKNTTKNTILFVSSRINSKSKWLMNTGEWVSDFKYKLQIKGRMNLKLNFLLENNPQLRAARIQRYRVYQRLFAYGYLATIANSFFMQRTANTTFNNANPISLPYNLVFADIVIFRLWSLRKFIMRPIYMKRLFCLSLGSVKKKQISKALIYIRGIKSKRFSRFFKFFQYSLYSLVYSSFKIMGLEELLQYIKAGFFTVNGQIITNPLYACNKHDLIQFNVFYLFKRAETEEFDFKMLRGFKQKHSQMKNLTMFFLLSFFKSSIMFKPFSKRKPRMNPLNSVSLLNAFQVRLKQETKWRLSVLSRTLQVRNKYAQDFYNWANNNHNVYHWDCSASHIQYYQNILIGFNNLDALYSDTIKDTDKKSTKPKKIIKQTIYSSIIKLKAHFSSIKNYLSFTSFISSYLSNTSANMRLKKRLLRMNSLGLVTREFKVKGQLRTKMGWSITIKKNRNQKASNIKFSVAHLIKQRRNAVVTNKQRRLSARTLDGVGQIKRRHLSRNSSTLVDTDVFAVNILSQNQKNRGNHRFLNQASARFLLTFCAKM